MRGGEEGHRDRASHSQTPPAEGKGNSARDDSGKEGGEIRELNREKGVPRFSQGNRGRIRQ